MAITRRRLVFLVSIAAAAGRIGRAAAASAREIDQQAERALGRLYAAQPRTRVLGERAKAILVFPRIVKAGFVIGGEGGDGVLRSEGRVLGYYNISAGSFGLQAGAQEFSYALFFMNEAAVSYLNRSNGWSVGAGPSVVVLDKGAAASVTSATLTHDVYAVPFGESGLMAGLGLEGSKITRIHPSI